MWISGGSVAKDALGFAIAAGPAGDLDVASGPGFPGVGVGSGAGAASGMWRRRRNNDVIRCREFVSACTLMSSNWKRMTGKRKKKRL